MFSIVASSTMLLRRIKTFSSKKKDVHRMQTLSLSTLRGRSNSTIQADKEYIDTIQELFQMAFIPARVQKHSNDELFAKRKVFFNKLSNKYKTNNKEPAKIIHIAGQ